jgi:GNAT superfamily N-acetyltransferase
MSGSQASGRIDYRAANEEDHPAIVEVVDEWAGGRRVHEALPRLWLRHFSSTSLVAETAEGRLAGFLVGFVSPDRPSEAGIVCLGVSPSHRKRGIGRGLVERFAATAAGRGAREVVTAIWPGDPIAVAFHRAIGFEVDAGPGTQNRYGTPSYPDHDAEREDRAIMRLPIR